MYEKNKTIGTEDTSMVGGTGFTAKWHEGLLEVMELFYYLDWSWWLHDCMHQNSQTCTRTKEG